MNCLAVFKCNDSEDSIAEFRHATPEPEAPVLLCKTLDWILDDGNAQLYRQVRPLPTHLSVEVPSRRVHAVILTPVDRAGLFSRDVSTLIGMCREFARLTEDT